MPYISLGKILVRTLLFVSILISSQVIDADSVLGAYTRRSRTYDTQYQEVDRGRYRANSALQNQINVLSSQPIVTNLRIPLFLGVTKNSLEDTWGDARDNSRTHEGIDIMATRGTPIVSPTDAIVTTVENSGNGGNHVFTANPGGERYYYAHLNSFAKGLAEGQVLKAGDLIGYVGNTGNASNGPTHLHFGIYQDDHNAINPFPRLTLEFSLSERIETVTKMLNASDDPQILAQALVTHYRSIFTGAQTSNIVLPTTIGIALRDTKLTEMSSITRTLKVGSKGDDVKSLQINLGILSDGDFGPKTKAAVIVFQISHGLGADGIFGPVSRIALAASAK